MSNKDRVKNFVLWIAFLDGRKRSFYPAYDDHERALERLEQLLHTKVYDEVKTAIIYRRLDGSNSIEFKKWISQNGKLIEVPTKN